MVGHRLKIIIVYIIVWKIILIVDGRSTRRSPLELGFVTFPAMEIPMKLLPVNKTKAPNTHSKHGDFSKSVSSRISRTHEWLPGRIRDHAYIPAHIHQIFIPLLIPVKQHPAVASFELYPRQFGGFGIGSYYGEQGAGHGFQIVFNNS